MLWKRIVMCTINESWSFDWRVDFKPLNNHNGAAIAFVKLLLWFKMLLSHIVMCIMDDMDETSDWRVYFESLNNVNGAAIEQFVVKCYRLRLERCPRMSTQLCFIYWTNFFVWADVAWKFTSKTRASLCIVVGTKDISVFAASKPYIVAFTSTI